MINRVRFRNGLLRVLLGGISTLLGVTGFAIEPEIHDDRSVTFWIEAPEARRVQIDVKGRTNAANGGKPFDLSKDESGKWRLKTEPLDPGFHYYFVLIDGFRCADASNPLYFGWQRPTNGIEIPDPNLDCYIPRQVPRGEIRIRPYFSKRTQAWREAYVYTPPGYAEDLEKKYPTLYLQHGAGENQTSWTRQGKANVIMDNLLADGKCSEMIIVMDRGYAYAAGDKGSATGRRENLFGEILIHELIPVIEAHYRVIPERDSRALAGLSMGGGQAVRVGLSHLDRFAYLGCFSGAIRSLGTGDAVGALPKTAAINEMVKLFWLGCGTEDFVFERAKKFHDELDSRGIRHEFFEHSGTHEWQAWRLHLFTFAQRLF